MKQKRLNVDIVKALTDKKLLGQFIEDVRTWAAWFTFLRAFFALQAATRRDIETFKLCTERSEWPTTPMKEAWCVVGRRGGKSFVTALIAVYLAVFRQYKLSAGETGYIIIVSPTKTQSNIIKKYLSSFFNQNALLKSLIVRETREELQLSNNITIMTLSSDFRSLRGFTCIAAIVDEIAFFHDEGSKPDVEVIRALRPALATTGGSLIAISSPYAKRGSLYTAHKTHYGKDGSDVLVWQAPSIIMNPTLSRHTIDRAKLEDPDAAQAEWEAQFRADIESYVSREAVEACVPTKRYELPYVRGVAYSAFVDPSGGQSDSMTLAISHTEKGRRILDAVREVKPPFSPEVVVEDFSTLLKNYHVHTVHGDRYAGEWPRERFSVNGIQYRVSEKVKSDIYRDLLPLINSAQCELLDNDKLVNQLCNLERRTARGGRDSIDHPPNGHDDLANAVAGVLVIGRGGKQAIAGAGFDRLAGEREEKPGPFTQALLEGRVQRATRTINTPQIRQYDK